MFRELVACPGLSLRKAVYAPHFVGRHIEGGDAKARQLPPATRFFDSAQQKRFYAESGHAQELDHNVGFRQSDHH
jgi:hypothetical protein